MIKKEQEAGLFLDFEGDGSQGVVRHGTTLPIRHLVLNGMVVEMEAACPPWVNIANIACSN
mgnify:CR=1 FL=1